MNHTAFFGGSFDPIHIAHLITAQDISEKTGIEKIIFLPTFSPPHKETFASFSHRVNMVKLAIEGDTRFECWDEEKNFSSPSYTINTLMELKKNKGISDISFIIGMDSATEFDTWKEADRLIRDFNIIVIPRPNFKKEDVLDKFRERMVFVNTREVDVSSTEIRERISAGKSIRYLLPEPVIKYIHRNGIYKS
jgi:nicotinate-nucleotide adenylyltransferase